MKENQTKKYYWGIGLENETYLQFEESLIVTGSFIQENIGCDRYSIDYRKCYKPEALAPLLDAAFDSIFHWASYIKLKIYTEPIP